MAGVKTPEAYDLLIQDPEAPDDPIGLMLVRSTSGPTILEEVLEPTELGSVSPPRPVPVIWQSWAGGAGVARPVEGVRGAYKVARNACTRFGAVTPAGGLHEVSLVGVNPASIYQMVPFGGDVVITTSSRFPLVMRGGVPPVVSAGVVSEFSSLQDMVTFRGALYVTGGSHGVARFNGTTWTEGASGPLLSRMKSVSWTRGGVPRRRLVGSMGDGSGFIYTTGDDPLNAAHWSAVTPIESAWSVQQLVAAPRHIYAVGPGGVFDLTENGETPCITGDAWARNYDPSNGATAVIYDTRLYVAARFGTFSVSLEGRLVDVMEDVSIGHLQPAELPVGGQLSVLGTLDGWLTQVTWNQKAGGSQLWYGMRRERTNAPTPWPIIWHGSECDLPGQQIMATCAIAPVGAPRRMYLATRDLVSGQVRLWWHDLPKYGSPLQDWAHGNDNDRMTYARGWDVTQTEEVLGDPGSTKDPLWWDVLGRNLGGANHLTVHAAGRDGAFVEQGSATVGDTRFGAHGVTDKGIVVKVEGANSESVPAVLDAVKGSWVVTVEESATVLLPVMYGPGVSLLNGSEDRQDAAVTFGMLQKLAHAPSLVATRWDGSVLTIRVEQGVRRRWFESPDKDGWVDGAVVPITILAHPMRHDSGDRHDLLLRHDA